MGLDVMNEFIDSTMGRIPRMLAVLLARDDPRTSWSFQAFNGQIQDLWVGAMELTGLCILMRIYCGDILGICITERNRKSMHG